MTFSKMELRRRPATGGLLLAGAFCLALANPALAQESQSQPTQASEPSAPGSQSQQGGQTSQSQQGGQQSQSRQIEQMLQQIEGARQNFEQVAQGGDSGNVDQARQRAEQALQSIEQNLERMQQQGGSQMQRAVDDLRQKLEQANTAIQDAQGQPDEAARSLQEVETALRQIQQRMAAQGGGGQQGQDPAQVRVQQPPAQVEVQQQQPDVTVRQPQPEITVRQPEPEVTVTQPEPEVTVEQGRPQVDVQQKGEPQVEVERESGAEVQVERPGEGREQQQSEQPAAQSQQQAEQEPRSAQQDTQTSGADQSAAIGPAAIRGDDVIGKQLRDANGQQLGDIEDVVMEQGRVNAVVVEVGGFLGIGERRVAIPTERLTVQGEDVSVEMTQEEIEQLPEYQEPSN